MKDRSYKMFLEDILESLEKIEKYTEQYSYDQFILNSEKIDAVLRNLEIMGEAAGKIPAQIKTEYPDIPWKKMIDVRNITIHEYFGVDKEIIWNIIKVNLPPIKPLLKKMINETLELF